jgi:hypothetical protein
MSTPNFRDALNGPAGDLNQFDAAAGDDLAAFDNATGQTFIPAGWYTCTVARGELSVTKAAGKPCYRLALDVADGPHKGHRVWRTSTFDTPANANRAKTLLGPLGLRTGADLKKPFPGPGRQIKVKALLGVNTWQGATTNTIERLEVIDDRTAPSNPNSVNLDEFARGEGGNP